MNVKPLLSNLLVAIAFIMPMATDAQTSLPECSSDTIHCVCTDTTAAADSAPAPTRQYMQHTKRRIRFWNAIIPNLSNLQYAGDIGMISMGMGWDYGKQNQWETFLMFGFTPHHHTPHTYVTMALKEMYTPWDIKVWRNIHISPLFASFTISTLLDGEFWIKNPERYPSGYYSFSTKTRFHLGIGQKVKLKNIEHKSHWLKHLALYYEVSTCDLYLINKIRNRSVPFSDIITLAIGFQATIF